MGFMDLPVFILNELSSGPYGPYVTQRLAEIQKWYQIYEEGAEFNIEDVGEDSKEKNFIPTELKSKKIKRLINKQAEFMVGKPPDIKVTCPNEVKTDNGKPNETAMQEYL